MTRIWRSEFFGPDLGGFFPALGGGIEVTGRAPWVDVESLAEQEVTETESHRPSRREIRRAFRQDIPIDICEIDDDSGGYYLVEAELPGVPKENNAIHVDHNNVLSIDARPPQAASHTCALLMGRPPTRPSSVEAAAEGRAPETPLKPSQPGDLPIPQESPTGLEKEQQQQQEQVSSTSQPGSGAPASICLASAPRGAYTAAFVSPGRPMSKRLLPV